MPHSLFNRILYLGSILFLTSLSAQDDEFPTHLRDAAYKMETTPEDWLNLIKKTTPPDLEYLIRKLDIGPQNGLSMRCAETLSWVYGILKEELTPEQKQRTEEAMIAFAQELEPIQKSSVLFYMRRMESLRFKAYLQKIAATTFSPIVCHSADYVLKEYAKGVNWDPHAEIEQNFGIKLSRN